MLFKGKIISDIIENNEKTGEQEQVSTIAKQSVQISSLQLLQWKKEFLGPRLVREQCKITVQKTLKTKMKKRAFQTVFSLAHTLFSLC